MHTVDYCFRNNFVSEGSSESSKPAQIRTYLHETAQETTFPLTSAIVLDVVQMRFGSGSDVVRMWFGGGSCVFSDLVQTVRQKLREIGFLYMRRPERPKHRGTQKPININNFSGLCRERVGVNFVFLCVLFLWGKGKYINKIPRKSHAGQSRDNPGIIQGQSREILVYVLSCLLFFFSSSKSNMYKRAPPSPLL